MSLHCWKGKREHMEEVYGFGSSEWAATYVDGDGSCMLEQGHDGEHEFTPDSDISVTFAPPAPEQPK